MATVNLSNKESIDTTKDNVVIANFLEGIPGGRTLNVEGFADKEISAGHVIIKDDSSGDYKPLPVSGTKPAAHSYAGILVASLSVENAQAAIMVRGTVNEAYCKYAIPSEVKTDLKLILFTNV